MFFDNLLLGEKNILKNRETHINFDTVNDTVKTQNGTVNDTVLSLIKNNNKITVTEISDKLGISLSTAKRKTKQLKNDKVIERIGSDKAGSWRVL